MVGPAGNENQFKLAAKKRCIQPTKEHACMVSFLGGKKSLFKIHRASPRELMTNPEHEGHSSFIELNRFQGFPQKTQRPAVCAVSHPLCFYGPPKTNTQQPVLGAGRTSQSQSRSRSRRLLRRQQLGHLWQLVPAPLEASGSEKPGALVPV